MLTQTSVPGTDDWWVIRLATEWGINLPRAYTLQSYLDGTNKLPEEWDMAMREAYRRFLKMSRLNMADLVVNARVNRMRPLGFRTAAPGDQNGDAAAMANWSRSHAATQFRQFITDGGTLGSSFITVDGPTAPSATADPMMYFSSAFTTWTSQYDLMPWLAEAAIVVSYDAINEADIITLFRPGYMRRLARSARVSSVPTNGRPWRPGSGWVWVEDPVRLGFTDVVPVFRMDGPAGMGMFEKHLDVLDRINHTIRERLTITAMQAFRQRAIEGELPEFYPQGHPMAGQRINYDERFKAGPAATWVLGEAAKMWESQPTDITPILTAIDRDIRHLAAVTSTPLYILDPDATNVAAGAADKAGEPLRYSILEWQQLSDEPVHAALQMQFAAQADPVRASGQIQTIWAEIDPTSTPEKAQAALSAKQAGLSTRTILERIWQMTPDEIDQELQNQQDDAFLNPAPSLTPVSAAS
jgi:hypothetical protein